MVIEKELVKILMKTRVGVSVNVVDVYSSKSELASNEHDFPRQM